MQLQDSDLMLQREEFRLQAGAAANAEREQATEGGKNCDHAHDDTAVTRNL